MSTQKTTDELQLELALLRGERSLRYARLPGFITHLAKLDHHTVQKYQRLAREHPHFPMVQEYAALLARIAELEVERDQLEAAEKPPADLRLRRMRAWHRSGKETA